MKLNTPMSEFRGAEFYDQIILSHQKLLISLLADVLLLTKVTLTLFIMANLNNIFSMYVS